MPAALLNLVLQGGPRRPIVLRDGSTALSTDQKETMCALVGGSQTVSRRGVRRFI